MNDSWADGDALSWAMLFLPRGFGLGRGSYPPCPGPSIKDGGRNGLTPDTGAGPILEAMRGLGLVLLLVLAATAASAQMLNQYEMQFGEPMDVNLNDLLNSPDSYLDRAVRTHGQLEMGMDLRTSYRLRDTFGGYLIITPINDISYHFEQEARKSFGKEFEITGVFRQRNTASTTEATTGPRRRLRHHVLGLPGTPRTRTRRKRRRRPRRPCAWRTW